MFGIFKKKEKKAIDTTRVVENWSFLKTDIHSHLIPGIDDGTECMEDTIDLLKRLKKAGFSKVVTTPHISQDYFPNKESDILKGLDAVRAEVLKQGLEIEVEAAAEYMVDEIFMSKLANGEKLLTLDGKHVLIEMGFVQESPHLMQAIFQLQVNGYIPVLAHPERYNFYIDSANGIASLKTLKEAGCLLQLNIIALTGYYGMHIKKFSEQILEHELYDFSGSDLHHLRHFGALDALLNYPVAQYLFNYNFLNKQI